MSTSINRLGVLCKVLERTLSETTNPEHTAIPTETLRGVRLASYRPSPRVPYADLIEELDAAEDAIRTVFEMMADGYVPNPGEIEDLRARLLIPIHHGAFALSYERLDEPARWLSELARQRGLRDHVLVMAPGQTERFVAPASAAPLRVDRA